MNRKIMLSLVTVFTLPAMAATNAELEAMLIKMQKDFTEYKAAQEKKISALEKQLAQKNSTKAEPRSSGKEVKVAQKSTVNKPKPVATKKKHTASVHKSTSKSSTHSTVYPVAKTQAPVAATEAKAGEDGGIFTLLTPDRGGFRVATTDMGTLNISVWIFVSPTMLCRQKKLTHFSKALPREKLTLIFLLKCELSLTRENHVFTARVVSPQCRSESNRFPPLC